MGGAGPLEAGGIAGRVVVVVGSGVEGPVAGVEKPEELALGGT